MFSGIYKLTACVTFFLCQERVQRAQSTSKRSQLLLPYSANDQGAYNLHFDLKKAQEVAAVRSGEFVTVTMFELNVSVRSFTCKELNQRFCGRLVGSETERLTRVLGHDA